LSNRRLTQSPPERPHERPPLAPDRRPRLCTPQELAVGARTRDPTRAWLDTWSGLGVIVTGVERYGFELWLAEDRNGWRSTFLHRGDVMQPCVGQVLCWSLTPWRAVQEGLVEGTEHGAGEGLLADRGVTAVVRARTLMARTRGVVVWIVLACLLIFMVWALLLHVLNLG